jgi:hypothetical protein
VLTQVAEEDLKRVAAATGAAVQSTVNNLNPKVLGTCESFEEVQVRHVLDMMRATLITHTRPLRRAGIMEHIGPARHKE